MKPVYTQTDDDATREAASLATGLYCDPADDRTRQEFKDESDINWLLHRYGALPDRRPVQYGDEDFTTDLLSAYEAVQTAQNLFDSLDPTIRAQFASWRDLAQKLVNDQLPVTAPPQPTSTVAGISSPDAAAVAPPAGNQPPPNAIPTA